MKPTRAGLGLTATVVLCLIIGRLFGALELYLLAGVAIAVLVGAAIYTTLSQLSLAVSRTAHPSRVRAGVPARVDLTLQNRRRRSTPVIRVDDQIAGNVAASVHLAPIAGHRNARIAYRIPTARRGEMHIGPLALTVSDPLGLTSNRTVVENEVRVVVHPQLLDLGTLQATAGYDPTADLQPIKALATSGDEFFGLRPYVPGDDPRRVDWRTTARTGDLIVRQQERPQSGRVTVILDRRTEHHDDASFDRACSVAISALYAGWRGRDALRFATTTSGSVTDIRTRRDLDAIDDRLATISPTSDASIVRAVDDLGRSGQGGTLVLITGSAGSELDSAIDHARRSFGLVLPVTCRAPIPGSSPAGTTVAGFTIDHLDAEHPEPFLDAWSSSLRRIGVR